jgi:uncharacterized membrane protein
MCEGGTGHGDNSRYQDRHTQHHKLPAVTDPAAAGRSGAGGVRVVSDLIFKQSTLYLALVFVALAAIVSTKSCTTTAHASAARTVVQSAAARVGTIITHCAECPEMIPVRISLSGSPKDILVAKTELTWRQYMYIYDRAKCPIPRSIKGLGSVRA